MTYDWEGKRSRMAKRILALSVVVVLVVALWCVVVLAGLRP